MADFVPVFILGFLALGLGLTVLAISHFIGPRNPSPVKDATYESGLAPIGPGQRQVPVRYYLVATLFILFDIEVVYLFPWAVQFRQLARPVAVGGLGMGALTSMGLFLGILFLGFIYVWKKGVLDWVE